jgi:DNA ligase-1
MRFAQIATTSRRVSETSKRLEKIAALAECLRGLKPHEIEIGVAYLAGVTPRGQIRIGPALIHEAWPQAAVESSQLELAQVDEALARIGSASGSGSKRERTRLLNELMAHMTREEQDFLARLLVGELRQGALEGVMIDAIARAADVAVAKVRKAAMLAGSLARAARAALMEGEPGFARFMLEVGRPVLPMLAQPAEDVTSALQDFGTAAFEWKLDGARVQVHKAKDDIRVFSRSLNEVTLAVPEIIEAVRSLHARELILDGEAIALRPSGAPQPFQITMRRFGRRLNVAEMREALPLSVSFFDCLLLEGEDLLERPAHERWAALDAQLPKSLAIPRLVTADVEQAEAFFEDAIRHGHEGLMAKAIESIYDAGNRGSSWLKVKPAHTLDLVVLAAEWGHGRRTGYLSNLHLGAYDPETGQFVMLGKTFKGMTDELLAWQTRNFQELETSRDGYTVYLRPELVVEIAFNDVQDSPRYPAGLALRLARVKRYRPDKRPEEADTIETVRAIYATSIRQE